jgi:hypothetical protein
MTHVEGFRSDSFDANAFGTNVAISVGISVALTL